jgi:hypothetical protein
MQGSVCGVFFFVYSPPQPFTLLLILFSRRWLSWMGAWSALVKWLQSSIKW